MSRLELEADRKSRIAREAVLIAEADADIAAGLFVDGAEVGAWIDSIGTDNELPVPYPRHLEERSGLCPEPR